MDVLFRKAKIRVLLGEYVLLQIYFLSELIITNNCLQGALKSDNGVESYRLLKILDWYLSMKACVYFNAPHYVYTYIYRHVKSTIWKKSIHRQLPDLNKHTFLGVIWASNDEKLPTVLPVFAAFTNLKYI